jgi:hypothetical protein
MKSLRVSAVAVSVLALCMTGFPVTAKGKVPAAITVAFGTGNNNSQQGNTPNHHILPQEFKVRITSARKLDGTLVSVPATVNFVVSGFHWVWVYKNGVSLEEVAARTALPPTGPFLNYETAPVSNVLAKGIFPGNPPGFTDGAPYPLSPAQNRTDTIAFSAPGKYLVMCNVRGHFIDGMYAWVHVLAEDEEDDDDQGGN